MKARDVLNDCILARDYFSTAVGNGDYQQAKILWFSCVTLLRAVGHVLHKVDSQNFTAALRDTLNSQFKQWKTEDAIFRDFIEKERNIILKEYDLTIEVSESEEPVTFTTSDGYQFITSDGRELCVNMTLMELVKARGHGEGNTPLSVLDEAIEWWKSKLKLFE
ncbi:hypothetical protein [Rheinheimera faecalis]|uniref:hypothetical protein n=1 Tax=Rheinheimera faecalis TaxID=2901141 RepID=UPI001E49911D|nr:hypothetical protein [Rheinheimera faecalis]